MKVVLTGLAIGSIPFLFLAWLQVTHPDGDINMESAPAVTSDAQVPAHTSTEAQQACVQALQDAAKFPSSFDFSPFTDPPQAVRMNDGSYRVRVDFSAKNSFGNMLPQVGHCSVRDGVATVTEVDPR